MVGRSSSFKRRLQTLLPLLILGIVVVSWDYFAAARDRESPLECAAVGIVNAVAAVVSVSYNTVVNSAKGMVNARALVEENKRLRAENAELEARITKLFGYSIENKRYRELLKLQESEGAGVAARIIAVEAGTQAKRVTVNKGRLDGIGERFIAIAPSGLVGRVLRDKLGAHTTEIALIIDPRSGVAGMVLASGDKGVVVGDPSGPGFRGHLLSMDLPGDAVVREGDVVVSSGYGGVYPRGYRIGRVVSVKRNPADASQIASIRPFVDFAHLETLLLVPAE